LSSKALVHFLSLSISKTFSPASHQVPKGKLNESLTLIPKLPHTHMLLRQSHQQETLNHANYQLVPKSLFLESKERERAEKVTLPPSLFKGLLTLKTREETPEKRERSITLYSAIFLYEKHLSFSHFNQKAFTSLVCFSFYPATFFSLSN